MISTDELTPDDIRTARFHMLMSALATGLTMLALYLGSALTVRREPASDERACTLDTEAAVCDEDESCVRGQCQRPPPTLQPLPCQEGDLCDGECACDGLFACDPATRRCAPRQEDVCSPEITRLLTDLRRFEKERCQGVGSGATTCTPRDLQNFFIEHEKFDELLLGLQHGATVHFDKNQPGSDGLPAQQAAYYERAFHGMRERLKQARHILVIGRASDDNPRNRALNYALAQLRITEVQQWLAQLEDTPSGQDAMRDKLITLAIGTSNPLDPARLAGRPYHTFIAWRDQSSQELRAWIRGLDGLDAETARTLKRRLNQSVLVVPVPCDIPEAPANRDLQP